MYISLYIDIGSKSRRVGNCTDVNWIVFEVTSSELDICEEPVVESHTVGAGAGALHYTLQITTRYTMNSLHYTLQYTTNYTLH